MAFTYLHDTGDTVVKPADLTSMPVKKREGNLSDEVYHRLRKEIIRGELRPDEALVEVEVAERLNVSRTPVRESLQRLAADGLIVSRRRRWVVYRHSPGEIAEIYEVRAALEGYAARLAATRATPVQRAQFAAARGEVTSPTMPLRERVDANERFHALVLAASNNSKLIAEAERTRQYAFNYTVAGLYSPEALVESSRQHDELLDAILSGDPQRAADAARHHVEYSLQVILNNIL